MWFAYAFTSDEAFCCAVHPSHVEVRDLLIREYPDINPRNIFVVQMDGHGSAMMEDESWTVATWESES